jgi:hypothetical protein
MARGNGRSPTGRSDGEVAAENSYMKAMHFVDLVMLIQQVADNSYELNQTLYEALRNGEILNAGDALSPDP